MKSFAIGFAVNFVIAFLVLAVIRPAGDEAFVLAVAAVIGLVGGGLFWLRAES